MADYQTPKDIVFHPEWLVDSFTSYHVDPSRAIIITGFWRSGTTWLLQSVADSLQAKSVFEPLHLSIDKYRDTLHEYLNIAQEEEPWLHLFMPFAEESNAKSISSLKRYIERALTSAIFGFWIRRAREYDWKNMSLDTRVGRGLCRVRKALKTQVVTKFVRGQLLVGALQDWFNPTIIHVSRDPRAVIPSFERSFSDWWHHLSLEEQLLRVDDGRTPYFEKWESEICSFDEKDRVARLAAYWALTERFVRGLKESQRPIFLSYEKLCLEGDNYLRSKLNQATQLFTRGESETPTLAGDSVTTFGDRTESSVRERLLGWREELSSNTIQKIESTVDTFGMTDMLAGRYDT